MSWPPRSPHVTTAILLTAEGESREGPINTEPVQRTKEGVLLNVQMESEAQKKINSSAFTGETGRDEKSLWVTCPKCHPRKPTAVGSSGGNDRQGDGGRVSPLLGQPSSPVCDGHQVDSCPNDDRHGESVPCGQALSTQSRHVVRC